MSTVNTKLIRYIPLVMYVIFFSIIIYYFFNYFEYVFFYQEKSKLFLTTFFDFKTYLDRPGGLLEYVSDFITSLYYYPRLGALIVAGEIILIVLFSSLTAKRYSGRQCYFIPFFIGGVFFFMHLNHYFLNVNTLGVMLQLALFYSVMNFSSKKTGYIIAILFPLWYYVTGVFSGIFMILFIFDNLIKKEKGYLFRIITIAGVWAIFFFIGSNLLFYKGTSELLYGPFTYVNCGGQEVLFVYTVLLLILLPAISMSLPKSITGFLDKKELALKLAPVIVFGLVIFFSGQRVNRGNIDYFEVEKLFYEGKYAELVKYNYDHQVLNRLSLFLNNIALSQTGQLLNRMFYFPQDKNGGTLFLRWGDDNEIRKRGGYFYYFIGMVNEAHRWAFELMVVKGYMPEQIKMIARTEIINGHYNSARKYVDMLKNTLFYKDTGKKYEKYLNNEKLINSDPELGRIRRLLPRHDFFVNPEQPIIDLDMILKYEKNINVRALEYQVAYLLIRRKVGAVVSELPLFERAGYKKLPVYVAEAVAPFKFLNIGKWPELKYLKISDDVRKRFYEFNKIQNSKKPNKQQLLFNKFGFTYWYYVFYRK